MVSPDTRPATLKIPHYGLRTIFTTRSGARILGFCVPRDRGSRPSWLHGLCLQFLAVAKGVPWADALQVGSLIGTKIVLNEFARHLDLSAMIAAGKLTTDQAIYMASFALCGLANSSSIAIEIGGIAPLAPERWKDLAALGLRAVLGGTLAKLSTAPIAGIFFA